MTNRQIKTTNFKAAEIALDFVVFCIFITFARNMLPQYITGIYLVKICRKVKSMVFSLFLQKKHSQQINLEKLMDK